MRYEPYQVSIMALQEIGRNDLTYFIDHQFSRQHSTVLLPDGTYTDRFKVPHFDGNYIGSKEVSSISKVKRGVIRVPYIPQPYSTSHMDEVTHFVRGHEAIKVAHSDKVLLQYGRLYASVEDLALVERAMFLGFKYAGLPYGCSGCEAEFHLLGVHMTKESDQL